MTAISRTHEFPLILLKGFLSFLILFTLIWGLANLIFSPFAIGGKPEKVQAENMISQWSHISGNKTGKVIFARPPDMFILNLKTGMLSKIPNITVAGGRGRKMRGFTPRPFWSPDGKRFIYRYDNKIYVSNGEGEKKIISNKNMDTAKETRWSWWRENTTDWAVGPSKDGNIMLVNIMDPSITKTVYEGKDVDAWCEITGNGKFVVLDTGEDIFVAPVHQPEKRIKISWGQSCRPCAAPDNRVAWLPVPHKRYLIFNAADGKPAGELPAPKNEEIYRLNWSNHPDFSVHGYGSNDNQRMHVRQLSTGKYIFIGEGWDPDLWVE